MRQIYYNRSTIIEEKEVIFVNTIHKTKKGMINMSTKKRPHRIEIYQDSAGKWRWREIAGNGKIVNASEQGYASRAYCESKAPRV